MLCAATQQALEATAFVNPDGSTAVVVMNRSEAAIKFTLWVDGGRCATELPARAMATYLIK